MSELTASRRVLYPIVAIDGVDGCGKSTIIEEVKMLLSCSKSIKAKSRFVSGHNNSRNIIWHHAQPAHSPLISIIKLFVDTAKWTIRYCGYYITRLRGEPVFIDRHRFYCMTLDPLRFRYGGPISLVSWVNSLLPQPHINILLDAPVEVLYSRKQEMPRDEVCRLVSAYRKLFAVLPNAYIVDATQTIHQVACDVIKIVKEHTKIR